MLKFHQNVVLSKPLSLAFLVLFSLNDHWKRASRKVSHLDFRNRKPVVQICSWEKAFLTFVANLMENIHAEVGFQ